MKTNHLGNIHYFACEGAGKFYGGLKNCVHELGGQNCKIVVINFWGGNFLFPQKYGQKYLVDFFVKL